MHPQKYYRSLDFNGPAVVYVFTAADWIKWWTMLIYVNQECRVYVQYSGLSQL